MKNTIQELLKRPIAYQPIVAKATDSVKLAILWSQLYYWSDRTNDPDGWVYKTREDVFDETGLSRKEQETARKIGAKLGVMESERKGVQGIIHFRVDVEAMMELIEKYLEKHPAKEIPKKAKAEKREEKEPAQELPAWLDKVAWSEWLTYRTETKKSLKPSTIKLQLGFLEQNKADHAEIIRTSIRNGWQGLFPLKGKGRTPQNAIVPEAGKYAKYGK